MHGQGQQTPRVWLVGWGEIEEATGVSRKGLRTMIGGAGGLPIKMVGGRPVTTRAALEEWVKGGEQDTAIASQPMR